MSRIPTFSELMTAANDTTCPICSSPLRVVSTLGSGSILRCANRTPHDLDLRIESSPAIGTPRFGSAIGCPVHPSDTVSGYNVGDIDPTNPVSPVVEHDRRVRASRSARRTPSPVGE